MESGGTCSDGQPLAAKKKCFLLLSCIPAQAGANAGSVQIIDNAQNSGAAVTASCLGK
jgi:hypothetical protein